MISRYSRPEMAEIWSDRSRYSAWLRVELLACEAQHRLGAIPAMDLRRILEHAAFDPERIAEIEAVVHHDVIAFLTNVAEHVGPSSRFIHVGMTSSDVLDTALAAQLRAAADILLRDIREVRREVARVARRHERTPMIGRSHGVHAEPITFGLKMALMYDEFGRAEERLVRARDVVSVGKLSGAVGTHAHVDPRVESYVCRKLGLKPATISTQIVQRDRHAEFTAVLALVGTSVERWAQEFRHLQRTEVLEVEEGFAKGQKGSSAMPHKRNPILCERLCGIARVLRGYAVTAMENVPLWHERDISHSSAERIILPDATILLDYALARLAEVVRRLQIYPDNMMNNLRQTKGLIFSQSVLLALVETGTTREDAYEQVQRVAMECRRRGVAFRDALAADPVISERLGVDGIAAAFDIERHFRHVRRTFEKLGLRRPRRVRGGAS